MKYSEHVNTLMKGRMEKKKESLEALLTTYHPLAFLCTLVAMKKWPFGEDYSLDMEERLETISRHNEEKDEDLKRYISDLLIHFLSPAFSKYHNKSTLDSSLRNLGLMGKTKAFPVILPYLKHRDSFIRDTAVTALADLNDKAAIEPIMEAFEDRSIPVVHYACRNLIQLLYRLEMQNDEDIRKKAQKILERTRNLTKKLMITFFLYELGETERLKDIGKFLNYGKGSKYVSLRVNAASLLSMIVSDDTFGKKAEIIEMMKEALKDEKELPVRKFINGVINDNLFEDTENYVVMMESLHGKENMSSLRRLMLETENDETESSS